MKQIFMGILLTVSILLFMSPGTTFGQLPLDDQPSWEFGVKGGVNFANYTNSRFDYTDGLMLGAFVVYRIPEMPLGLQSEVLYTEKGAERFAVEFNTKYIDIPVLIKLYVPFEAGLEFRPFAGPFVGFPLDGELRDGAEKTDLSGELNTNFGGVFGIGAKLNAGSFDVVFEGRYSLAFNKAFGQSGTLEDSKSNSLAIAIELVF